MELNQPFPPQSQGPPPFQIPQKPGDDLQVFLPTKNMPSLLSYYFGVFGLIPFIGVPLAVAAIICAIIALKRYKLNPTPGAKGHAITGLVLGIFELACMLAFIATLLILAANNR